MKKRILSILLTLVMIIGLLPVTAFAVDATPVSEMAVSVTPPVGGEHPDFTAAVPSGAGYSQWTAGNGLTEMWWDLLGQRIMTAEDTFIAGRTYYAQPIFKANDGYAFADTGSITASMNGNPFDSENGAVTGMSNGTVRLQYAFIAGPEVIREMAAGVTPPAAGAHPDFTAAVPSGVGYSQWTEGSGITEMWWDLTVQRYLSADDTFVAGRTYYVQPIFQANTGYVFADAGSITASVNGNPFDSENGAVTGMSNGTVRLQYAYTVPWIYAIIGGNAGIFNKQGEEEVLSITADADRDKFRSISVDGADVDPSNYDVKSGSTIVELKKEYLNTLETGTHTLEMYFTDGSATATFTVEGTTPAAVIKVKKVDENNQPLAGAEFTLTGTNVGAGGPYTAVSDADGIAVFDGVTAGCYTMTETQAPAGYRPDATPFYIDVNSDGKAIVYGEGEGFEGGQKEYDNNAPHIFTNEQYKAEFYVIKTDGETALAGAEFSLENIVAGRTDYTAVSDADGKVSFTGVVDGEYILSETKAPNGYSKTETTVNFKVENGEVKYLADRDTYVAYSNPLSIVNTRIPTASFYVTKLNEKEESLAGAIFYLTEQGAAETAYEATSDADGRVSFENVVSGTYILSENTAPAGYVKTNETYTFLVNTAEEDPHSVVKLLDGDAYIPYENTLQIRNTPAPAATATIVVKKTDAEGAPLAGAAFILENDEDEYEAVSDENGLVTFTEVKPGYYTLKEVEAPAGYILNDGEWNFNVFDNGSVNGFSENLPNGYHYNNEMPLVIENEEDAPATMDITVVKEWDAPEGTVLPESVEVYLIVNREPLGDSNVILSEENNWTYTWEGMAAKDNDDIPIFYSVGEVKIDNYISQIAEPFETDTGYEIAIVNTYSADAAPVTVEIPVTKAVSKGGNTDFSGSETFEFAVELLNANVDTEALTITGNTVTVTGNAGGSTVIRITIPGDMAADVLSEGFRITEKAGSADGWTYSGESYLIVPGETGWEYYLEGEEADTPADAVEFTNTYTKNEAVPALIIVKKTDPDGNALSGAVFTLENASHKYVATSNVNGMVIFQNVTEGTYILTETEAPLGYVKADVNYSFNVSASGRVLFFDGTPGSNGFIYDFHRPVVVINEKQPAAPIIPVVPPVGSVKLTKVDADDHTKVLSGVVFELYRANGVKVGIYTTNANGMINIYNLIPGNYYWKEVQPAEGYLLSSAVYPFTVSVLRTANVVVENEKTPVPEQFTEDHYAYIVGRGDGLVHPEANITRAEVATIFFRLLNEKTRNQYMTKENSFSDVNEGDWFNTAVSTMAAMGILNGRPGGIFDPNAYITRAEFTAIAARFDLFGTAADGSFRDIYGHWAQKEINVAVNNGWVLGYEDGTFRPDDVITRAEAITMINRVLQRIPGGVEDLLPGMTVWADNMDTSKWYYLMIQEATNSHSYIRDTSGYEYWTGLIPTPDWAELED